MMPRFPMTTIMPRGPRRALAAALCATALAGCDLDTSNPNAPQQDVALTTAEGIAGVAVGLQARYLLSTGNFIYSAGLLTDELGATSAALVNVRDAERGRVENTAGVTSDVWFSEYRTIKTANDLIVNAPLVELDAPGTTSGILALAYTLTAGAIGELVQAYQRIADDDVGNPTPACIPRAAAIARALALLDSADAQLNATPASATFTTRILGTGLDLRNTTRAFRARLLRLSGPTALAATLAAANTVDRRTSAVLQATDQSVNPLFNTASGSSGVLPRDAFRTSVLAANPLDTARVNYHVTTAAVTGFFQPLDNYRRYGTATASVPLWYPDEVLLIKAEALVGLGRLAEAQAALDSVRTDCGGLVATDPNACLAPLGAQRTAAELTAEIYANRRAELFATGQRWEDSRRLGQLGTTSVGKRCWLPYPIAERNANPTNVPEDPEPIDAPATIASCF